MGTRLVWISIRTAIFIWDNAVSERFFHVLKTELIYQERYKTKDEAMMAGQQGLNDFRVIREGTGHFNPAQSVDLHNRA
jgi:hypothetical protein